MKTRYLPLLAFCFFFFGSCSKDFLRRYEDRIVGTWNITDVNRVGIGGNSSDVRFHGGTFTFNNDGSLAYVDENNNQYSGTWNIDKRTINNNIVRTLLISAVDFSSQTVTAAYYDDMNFRGTNHFVAKVNTPSSTFVTHFKR